VNNSNGRIGLVGYWDVVAFDEFAGREKTANKALVDIMKNYMANKQFSRGVNPMGAEASFAFVGNTDHNVPWMLKNTDLFEALPPQFHDSAFIDRLHAYLPGWEVDIIRGEMFTSGYGFIVDYLAEILRHLRAEDFSHRPDRYFTVPVQTHIRDRAAINKTMSGLLKLIFPNGSETEAEVEELLRFAIECRKRVKDQLLRIDNTFEAADFHYIASDGSKRAVITLEEEEFPQFYHRRSAGGGDDSAAQPEAAPAQTAATSAAPAVTVAPAVVPRPGHVVFTENRKGISFDRIIGPWTDGATRIIITDPYIRKFHQARNVMELIEMLIRRKEPEDQVAVHLVTAADDGNIQDQRECLDWIAEACSGTGVDFTWAFDATGTLHARDITTDTGWKMVLDRGLDIFQPTPRKMNGFSLGERMQEHRMVRGFYVTYVESA